MNARWSKEAPVGIMACDTGGIIVWMNDRAGEIYKKSDGMNLVGKSLFDCHPDPANTMIHELLSTRRSHCYTIEKNGAKAMVYQAPWYENGMFMGLVEFIFTLPEEVPNYKR